MGYVFSSLRKGDAKGREKSSLFTYEASLPTKFMFQGGAAVLLCLNLEEHGRKVTDESPVTGSSCS